MKTSNNAHVYADMIVRMPGIWHELKPEQKELVKECWRGPHFNHSEETIDDLVRFFEGY